MGKVPEAKSHSGRKKKLGHFLMRLIENEGKIILLLNIHYNQNQVRFCLIYWE